MTVFYDKERCRWRYDFQIGSQRYARECLNSRGDPVASKRAAQDCENEARRIAKLLPKLPRAPELTFGQIVNDLSNGWKDRRGWHDRKHMVREIVQFFGAATLIRDIDGARIQDYVAFAQRQPLMVWIGGPLASSTKIKQWKPHPSGKTRSAARVNRYLPILRAIFERAYNTRDSHTRERAIEAIPVIKDLAETKRKARPVPDGVLSTVLERLPAHVCEAVKVTLFFGIRRSEVFSLTVSQVDFDARGIRLEGVNVKDREDAFIPGSSQAMQFMAQLVDQAKDRNTRSLISYRPRVTDATKLASLKWRSIKSPKTAWRTAMKAIEKELGSSWRWHDIRAAFITHVAIMSGALAAQRMARHSDFKTTQGYIEVADPVMRAAAESATDRPALSIVKGGKR